MIYNSAMVKLTMRNKSFEVDAQWKLKLIGSRSKADRTLKDNCLSCCLFRERRVGESVRNEGREDAMVQENDGKRRER